MLLRKLCNFSRVEFWRRQYVLESTLKSATRLRNYSGISQTKWQINLYKTLEKQRQDYHNINGLRIRRFSNGAIDKYIEKLGEIEKEDEKKILNLFPSPRSTLSNLSSKTPDKIFDVHFKQCTIAPKGSKKKRREREAVQNDWTCSYLFVWPEKQKFESTSLSKRQAATKAATKALLWLYNMKRIDKNGNPIYDKAVLDKLKSTLNEPLQATLSDTSIQRVNRIWEQYQDEIKPIYDRTFEEMSHKVIRAPTLLKDSTLDDVDGVLENDLPLDDSADISELRANIHPVYGRSFRTPSMETLQKRDEKLKQRFQVYDEDLVALPIDEYRKEITSAVRENRVTIIVGAAGCGKSTRVPAAILRDFGANTTAIVTEPRRVAAMGLAETVASDFGEEVGDTVGYKVRLNSKPPRPPGGSILYCTSGVLLRRLQTNPGLTGCSHVFVDEAHERDVNTDVTLLLLRKALQINPDLRVVVMSATLDIDVFTRYFDSCPVIEVPGRTYPVQVMHLDDIISKFRVRLPLTTQACGSERVYINCQEVAEVVKAIDKSQPEGAILVFLPGWAEIKQTKLILDEHYKGSPTHLILPVHSRLSATDQSKMFKTPPPGVRKIVLCTNIAETSITIRDVTHVIDTGLCRENTLGSTGMATLETTWISQASAKQRAGRAGRVQAGNCYRLYTKEKEAEFVTHNTPEILRIPLDQTVLECKSYAPDVKVESFLSQLPEPPSLRAIQRAVKDLIDLGALTPSEALTRTGALISSLRVSPSLALTLLHAASLACILPAARLVSCGDSNVQMFVGGDHRKQEIRETKSKFSKTSDHVVLHAMLDEFARAVRERRHDAWCDTYGVRGDRMFYVQSLTNLHLEQVLRSGMIESSIEPDELNRFSYIPEIVPAVLLSGCDSLIVAKQRVLSKGKLRTGIQLFSSGGERAHIGGDSVNYNSKQRSAIFVYCSGHHSAERRALVVYKTSLVTPHTPLLFCRGPLRKVDVTDGSGNSKLILPKHKLEVIVPTEHADSIIKAKEMLWNTLQYYLNRDLKTLDYDENTAVYRFKVRLTKTLCKILVEAEKNLEDSEVDCDEDLR